MREYVSSIAENDELSLAAAVGQFLDTARET